MTPRTKIRVLPADITFECSQDETVLQGALGYGFALPYGCRKGNCGTCKAQVLEGEVDLETDSSYGLSSFEHDQGFTLICSAYPMSDLVIEMEGLDAADLGEATLPVTRAAVIDVIEQLTPDIVRLAVTLDAPLVFRSGQFALLELPGTGIVRSYSMAGSAREGTRLQFMIKLIPEGLFSQRLAQLRPGDALAVNGPHGSFWLRPHDRPIVLIGGGAGMAPLWSILQELAENSDPRPVTFFYGARTQADLFHLAEIEALRGRLPGLVFVPALSHEPAATDSAFAHGLITDVVAAHLGRGLAATDAYVCGPPPMIDAALELLTGFGLEERRSLFYDKFTAS